VGEAVLAKKRAAPLTPRLKYVRIEGKPEGKMWWCQSCGAATPPAMVRIGEYYDPSFLCCPTCIREAAALLETM
jgi:hypothetical protein